MTAMGFRFTLAVVKVSYSLSNLPAIVLQTMLFTTEKPGRIKNCKHRMSQVFNRLIRIMICLPTVYFIA